MKEQRKNRKISKVLFLLYLTVCLGIIISAYFRLSQIAHDFNTQHLELITGLYAEKMNTSMEYLQNYAQEDVTMIQSMEDQKPAEILQHLRDNLDQTLFCNVGLILKNQKILSDTCTISDIQEKKLDQTAMKAKESFFLILIVPARQVTWFLLSLYLSVIQIRYRHFLCPYASKI